MNNFRFRLVLLFLCFVHLISMPVHASPVNVNDGSVILRMCKGADKVKALSVMCHSYLNGYIDGARHFSKGKVTFCLQSGDKEKAPSALVEWIDAHPEVLKQPAGSVLEKALSERFPCKGKAKN